MGGEHNNSELHLDRNSSSTCCSRHFWISVAEISAIVILFFVYAGHPAPDVNEAHYLAKAKHFWQPTWCAGDAFLESDDAHIAFYWTAGWLTKFMSLTAFAWFGRIVTWLLLAATWHQFIRCFTRRSGDSLFSAAIALCLWHHFHLAGEWVVGGFEAKGFAMAFLFVALRRVASNQWGSAFVALGAASSFHVLVGGWGVLGVAATLATRWKIEQPNPKTIASGLIGGGLLALPGLVPALWLMSGVDATTQQRAAEIYVDRLGHHLEIYRMAPERIAMFGMLLVAWSIMRFLERRAHARRSGPIAFAVQRIQRFVSMSVVIGIVGWMLDYFSIVLPAVDRLLRFYFFRLADIAVPIGVVVSLVVWLQAGNGHPNTDAENGNKERYKKRDNRGFATCAILVAVTITLATGFIRSPKRRVAPAFVQGLGRDLNTSELRIHWRDWQDTCGWIDKHTPTTARCLTPTISQTFCWYANRPEVAVWKNIPQDAMSIVHWRETMNQIHASSIYPKPNATNPPSFVDPSDLARKYDFEYLVATDKPSLPWPRVYRNATYIVYRNPRPVVRTSDKQE